jgi:hypothetical protein
MSGIHEVRGAIHGKGYVLVRPLVEGTDTVFEARHDRISGAYVVRLFPTDLSARSEAAVRLQSGARLATLLRHPGIVQVLDFNVAGEEPAFVVMENVEGQSLEELMAKNGMFPLPLAIDLIGQIGEALRAAHLRGIIHGDLHPRVIRMTEDKNGKPQAKVLGFGWSKELRALGRKRDRRSNYVAPEQQAAGSQTLQGLDERADQFSLAAIAYEMLAGCSHFSEENSDLAEPEARRNQQPPPLAELVLGLPAGLDEVLRRALSYDPRERFPRLQDFASALLGVTDPQAAGQGGATEATWEWPVAASLDAMVAATAGLGGSGGDDGSGELTPRPVSVTSKAAVSGGLDVVTDPARDEAGTPTPAPHVVTIDWLGLGLSPDGSSPIGKTKGEAAAVPTGQAEVTPPPVFAAASSASSPDGIFSDATEATPPPIASPVPGDRTPSLLASEEPAISASALESEPATPPPVAVGSRFPVSGGGQDTPSVRDEATPPPVSFPVMTFSAPDDMHLIGGVGDPILSDTSAAAIAAKPPTRTRVLFLAATVGVVCAAIFVMSGMRKGPTTTQTVPEVAAPRSAPKAPSAVAPKEHPTTHTTSASVIPPAANQPVPAAAIVAAPVAAPVTAEVAPSAAAETTTPSSRPGPLVVPGTATASTAAEIRGDRARTSRAHARRGAAHSPSARRDRRSR